MLFGHFHAGLVRVHVPGDDEGGDFKGKQPVEYDAPLLLGNFPQVAHLHITQYLQTHRLKVVEVSRQLQPGPGDVLHRHTNGFIVTGPVGRGQLKLLYQSGQGHAVGVDHDCHLIPIFTKSIIPNCSGNINRISKNFGFFPFSPCNLGPHLILYGLCPSGFVRRFSHGLEVQLMAKCDICGKGVTFGIKVSHSHRRSNRMWKPNVKRVKAIVDGTPRHVYVCTRCLRSNKVERAI